MIDELRTLELAEEAMTSERTPEEVCREFPELLSQVRERLARVRRLVEDLDVALPAGGGPERSTLANEPEPVLPTIPGYEVKGLLGRGGMGVVYKARHLRLDRDVALKMLLAGEFASPRELERFFLEARAIANLSHPNIVQVHDVSEREGRPYFTMELVHGGNLAQRLGGNPQAADRAAELVGCLARAVEVAHRSGIIHRDLKPANVLLTPDGIPKISDFGLARRVARGEALTTSGMILGTPSYMAPEQVRGSAVGSAADVYALGAILYEMLTGRPPFRSESPLATQMEVLSQDPVRPSQLNARVPRDLETICLKCLHKMPERRYSSAASLAEDLGRFQRDEPILARQASTLERAVHRLRRNPTRAALIATALALFGVALWGGTREWSLAAERRAVVAKWTPQLDLVIRLEKEGRFQEARENLQRVPDAGSRYLRDRIQQACSELDLAEHLDAIRMNRSVLVEGRFDIDSNKTNADREYEAAFKEGGLGDASESPDIVAARVRGSPIASALVAALDDWAICTKDARRLDWILGVARGADADSSGWRDRVRDPALAGEALEELARSAIVEKQSVQILVALAQRMQDGGTDPLTFLERVQRQYPRDFWANFTLGLALTERAPAEALRYYQAALAIRPEAAVAHLGIGRAMAAGRRVDEAIVHFRRAIDIDPGFSHAITDLGLALAQQGMLPEALERTQQALRLDPSSARNHNNVGDVLARLGRYDEAFEEVGQALVLDPDYIYALFNLIGLCERLGRLGEAEEHCEQAVRLAPTSPKAHLWHGRILLDQRRMDEAIPELELAIRLAPDDPDGHRMLAACLKTERRFDQALYHYDRALAARPYPDSYEPVIKAERRSVLLDLGRGEEARAEWQNALAGVPTEHDAYYGYAELCLFLGNLPEYQQACRALLERFEGSTNPQVCERTGRACLLGRLTAEEIQRARALVERAVHTDRSQYPAWAYPCFLVAEGLARYRTDDLEGAIRVLQGEASSALGPLPNLVLAMAYYRSGREHDSWKTLVTAIDSYDWDLTQADIIDAWIYHSVRREAEMLVLPRLPALVAGGHPALQADERIAMLAACRARNLSRTSARLFAESCEADPAMAEELGTAHRHHAACAAAQAGVGIGDDTAGMSEDERARWRAQALRWLWDDLTAVERLLDERSSAERRELAAWLGDPRLAGVRDRSALGRLPAKEREQWLELWSEVEAIVTEVAAGAPDAER